MLISPVRCTRFLALFASTASLAALGPLPASAQADHPGISSATPAPAAPSLRSKTHIQTAVNDGENCPVQFSAKRWGSGAVENTQTGAAGADERGLLIHLDAATGKSGVVQATVVVRGSSFRPHVAPADSSGSGTLAETFHLAGAERDAQENWKLITDQVPLVKEVDIVAMRFADGSRWKQADNAVCRVQPDKFFLVANRR